MNIRHKLKVRNKHESQIARIERIEAITEPVPAPIAKRKIMEK
jgi:hypothetical protein